MISYVISYVHFPAYLWVRQTAQVGVEVEIDSP